jgi:hypothetical protein
MGLLAPLTAVDIITWIGVPVALLLPVVVLLLLLELELQPVNTRHAAATAATGATNLSFIRPPMGAERRL